jgi:hypothetical protein
MKTPDMPRFSDSGMKRLSEKPFYRFVTHRTPVFWDDPAQRRDLS